MPDQQYAPPPGPPPSRYTGTSQNSQQYAPPPGPPPSWTPQRGTEAYEAPSGPPPGWHGGSQGTGPVGAPPGYQEAYEPPPRPPPTHHDHPEQPQAPPPPDQPQHDWTVIPDTSLLPPPPTLGHDTSPTANASADSAAQALTWCATHPLWDPQPLSSTKHSASQAGALALVQPREFTGEVTPLRRSSSTAPGTWACRSKSGCRDACLQAFPPVYSALADSPLRTGKTKVVYFEVRVLGMGAMGSTGGRWEFGRRKEASSSEEAGIAVGFFAPPYPTWRLPGWQRASLGVHGDDGRRYVNDTFGGKDFTAGFRPGEIVGVGIRFEVPRGTPPYGLEATVFFTRNGRVEGSWDLHEQLDERSEGGVRGLEGDWDLFAAVGVFGATEFEVRFSPQEWVYKP